MPSSIRGLRSNGAKAWKRSVVLNRYGVFGAMEIEDSGSWWMAVREFHSKGYRGWGQIIIAPE